MRFDDHQTREEKKFDDRLAPVRSLWNSWNALLPNFFNSSGFITVDEQLVSSRSRSPNRVFIPQKPGKFGELIRWACDSQYRYFFKGNPYSKPPENPILREHYKKANKAKQLVMDLVSPFVNQGYHITADRFFSSYDLAQELLNDGFTYLGTMMSNKREIPHILKAPLEVHNTRFAFSVDQINNSLNSVIKQLDRRKYT